MYFWSLKCQFPCDIGRVNYLNFAEVGISTRVIMLMLLMIMVKMASWWLSIGILVLGRFLSLSQSVNIDIFEDNRENWLNQWFLGKARERIPWHFHASLIALGLALALLWSQKHVIVNITCSWAYYNAWTPSSCGQYGIILLLTTKRDGGEAM